jgi:DNA-binding transcriptional MerR regulator
VRGGHRLYDGADVARLYRITLLRRLGFPLDQVSAVLDEPEWQLAPAIDRHLAHTQHRATIATRLCTRLAAMAAELDRHDDPSPEQLFSTLEEMTMLDGTIHGTTGLLVYEDIDAAHDYITQVFGLGSGHVEPDPEGGNGYREVRVGDHVIGLHRAASGSSSLRSGEESQPGLTGGIHRIRCRDQFTRYVQAAPDSGLRTWASGLARLPGLKPDPDGSGRRSC